MTTPLTKGFFQRTGHSLKEYFKRMGNDYLTVAKDTVTGCKERPVRAGFIFCGLGFLTYACKTNPSEYDLLNEMCERRHQMMLLPRSEQNPNTMSALTKRDLLHSQNKLHFYDLWFFSLLVAEPHNTDLRIYSSQDKNLKDWPWKEFWNGIIDVGVLGNWININKSFQDFDINEEEINQYISQKY